ncbi:uncharacterized protein CEXT_766801 [Caerostris extrusa]|uniref:F-box/LRR-repeat protein n=1 Tax=Caerostris extrusa TaxID=172846 RepID=A0AAV4V256_CAEEX|nr:uncharacterized protein CEXT_766801 [Caerostris extrusa]
MNPPTLYKICIREVSRYLTEGVWNKADENPVSRLPRSIASDLMKHSFSQQTLTFENSRLLLTCGLVISLDIKHTIRRDDNLMLFQMFTKDSGQTLRCLHLECHTFNKTRDLETLFQGCSKLKDLHIQFPFDLNLLRNYKLRSLKLHCCKSFEQNYSLEQDTKFRTLASSMQTLENFSICINNISLAMLGLNVLFSFFKYKTVASILMNCRRILSVGLVDSLLAINYIHTSLGYSPVYELRRCFWRILNYHDTNKAFLPSSYEQAILRAVLSCPYLKKLIFHVSYIEGIIPLRNLQNLTYLILYFSHCEGDILPTFQFLLKKIGHQLKYLAVIGIDNFPINMVCRYCKNLETLAIDGRNISFESKETSPELLCLTSLSIIDVDRSVLFLLPKCPNLKWLSLHNAECLNDELLQTVMEGDTLSQLKQLFILHCSISRSGLRLLLERTRSIDKIYVHSMRFEISSVLETLGRQNINIDGTVENFPPYLDTCDF